MGMSKYCMKYKKNLVFVDYDTDIESLNSVVDRTLYVAKFIQKMNYDILVRFSKIYVNILKGMQYEPNIHKEVIQEPFETEV
jgi:hypothetical protein